MKKSISIFFLAVVLTTFTFGLDISAGAGISGASANTTATEKGMNPGSTSGWFGAPSITASPSEADAKSKFRSALFGFNAFVDATFVEVDFGLVYGSHDDYTTSNFDIGVLGKYPIALNDKLTVFPLVGIDYQMLLSAKDAYGNKWGRKDNIDKYDGKNDATVLPDVAFGSYADNIWIKFGVGTDVALGEKLFLRNEFLYGIKLKNQAEKDVLAESADGWDGIPGYHNGELTKISTQGWTFKLAVGYKIASF